MTLIQWIIIICTIINIGGIFVSKYQQKKIDRSKKEMLKYKNEMLKTIDVMENLSHGLRGTVRMIKVTKDHPDFALIKEHFEEIEQQETYEEEEEKPTPKWEEVSKEAYEKLATIMNKKKRRRK